MSFWFTQNLVKLATKKNVKWLESEKEIIEKKAEEDLKNIQEVASKIDGVEVIITVKVGPEGQLFESINSAKISEKLKSMGFDIKKSKINLEEPIKKLGEFPVKVSLDHNLEVEIIVIVSGQSEEEI